MSSEEEVLDDLPIASSSTQPLTPDQLLTCDQLPLHILHASLLPLPDAEAVNICVELLRSERIDDLETIQATIDLGLSRCQVAIRTFEDRVRQQTEEHDEAKESRELEKIIKVILEDDEALSSLLQGYVALKRCQERSQTYQAIWPSTFKRTSEDAAKVVEDLGVEVVKDDKVDGDVMDIDDPWAETDASERDIVDKVASGTQEDPIEVEDPWETNSIGSTHSRQDKGKAPSRPSTPPVPTDDEDPSVSLGTFIAKPIHLTALTLAETAELRAIKTIYDLHQTEIWPYRFAILNATPSWTTPNELDEAQLLPRLDDQGNESPAPTSSQDTVLDILANMTPEEIVSSGLGVHIEPLDAEQVCQWYADRVESLDELGLVDLQLAWVQYGAGKGIPKLDALGEDLSLLSRLVYDSHLTPQQQSQWNLAHWRETDSAKIVSAYLSNSTSDSIVSDLKRLVLPYLYVLESKAEREGQADKDLVDRYLHQAILSLPLDLALRVFEASKATLSATQRLIKNDLTVARLALACLYGYNRRDAWSTMSAIFECLPVWDITGPDRDEADDNELTSTTLESIAAFVRPSKPGDPPPTAKDLFIFFSPLPFASLSRALDILDVHLESGEILARWDTPVHLRFLLQSAQHHQDQVELAERMIRKQSSNGNHTDHKWNTLWSDMLKLNGGSDASLKGAFGRLTTQEMLRIYLGGLLLAGRYDVAKRVIRRRQAEDGLQESMIEEVALTTSIELFDNAESGNIHTGGMKLAYECLSVAKLSPAINEQKDFIEATSRLTTFSLPSQSGSGIIRPIEIRHAKSKLELIRTLLNTSPDAFQHPEIILDLCDKLGYKGNKAARIQVLGMLVDAAVKAGEYDIAANHCQEMFTSTQKSAKVSGKANGESTEVGPSDITWKSCLLVGSQVDYPEIGSRITLLGQAVELCPPDQIPQILDVWRKVEEGRNKLDEAAKRRRIQGIKDPVSHTSRGGGKGLSVVTDTANALLGGEDRVLGSRRAARAARMAMDFAGDRLNRFGGGVGGIGGISPILSGSGFSPRERSRSRDGSIRSAKSPHLSSTASESGGEGRRSTDSDRPSFGALLEGHGLGVGQGTVEAERMRQQARKALVKGVGWLLGADEAELDG